MPEAGDPGLKVRAYAPSFYLQMGLFSAPSVMVSPDPPTRTVRFHPGRVFYEGDDGERVRFEATPRERRMHQGELTAATLVLHLPPPLEGITIESHKLPRSTIRAIEAIDGDEHRIYVSFDVDGEPYAIDAVFELDVGSGTGPFRGCREPDWLERR